MNIYTTGTKKSLGHSPTGEAQAGFSLIEMIVSLTVFLLTTSVVVSIFISMIQNQKRILLEQELLNQVSYAEEHMSRALRMATEATVDTRTDCVSTGRFYELTHPSGGFYTGIKFINQSDSDACQEFFLENGILKETRNGSSAQNLLSNQFTINSVKFIINGNSSSSYIDSTALYQPRITMLLDVSTKDGQRKIIQTTITQRNLNNNR